MPFGQIEGLMFCLVLIYKIFNVCFYILVNGLFIFKMKRELYIGHNYRNGKKYRGDIQLVDVENKIFQIVWKSDLPVANLLDDGEDLIAFVFDYKKKKGSLYNVNQNKLLLENIKSRNVCFHQGKFVGVNYRTKNYSDFARIHDVVTDPEAKNPFLELNMTTNTLAQNHLTNFFSFQENLYVAQNYWKRGHYLSPTFSCLKSTIHNVLEGKVVAQRGQAGSFYNFNRVVGLFILDDKLMDLTWRPIGSKEDRKGILAMYETLEDEKGDNPLNTFNKCDSFINQPNVVNLEGVLIDRRTRFGGVGIGGEFLFKTFENECICEYAQTGNQKKIISSLLVK